MNESIILYIKQYILFRLTLDLDLDIELQQPKYNFSADDSRFAKFVTENNLNDVEILVLLIAFLPYIAPGYLSKILSEYYPDGSDFPDFGGVKGVQYRGIIPTGETALYLIAGGNIDFKVSITTIFEEGHLFHKKSVLEIGKVEEGEPKYCGKLLLDQEFVDLILYGYLSKPKRSVEFPAELIETGLEWDDLILNKKTKEEVNELKVWLEHSQTLEEWGLKHKIKPGYRVMFHGVPGVGKTLTASLLGKQTGKDVYRIDLSLIVSKYIGETEKNLAKLFDKAINKNWILFFDEADAIFGKRTSVRHSNDKHSNQEVSFLLQRIENHPGLIILASNYKNNIDNAFTRRFNSIIEFKSPTYEERLLLWKKNLPNFLLSKDLDLEFIAKKYDITGANIINIVQYSCLRVLNKETEYINQKIITDGIVREYEKEGKMI